MRHMKETARLLEIVKEAFDYDPGTGLLKWKERPLSHFANRHAQRLFNNRFAGRAAGTTNDHDYVLINMGVVGKRVRLRAHRIAFALTNGRWPVGLIDHKFGAKSGNWIANLREASRFGNAQNAALPKSNTSGFMGVRRSQSCRSWIAQICAHGRHIHIGSFRTPEEAYEAYLAAKAQLHPFQPTPHVKEAGIDEHS